MKTIISVVIVIVLWENRYTVINMLEWCINTVSSVM